MEFPGKEAEKETIIWQSNVITMDLIRDSEHPAKVAHDWKKPRHSQVYKPLCLLQ